MKSRWTCIWFAAVALGLLVDGVPRPASASEAGPATVCSVSGVLIFGVQDAQVGFYGVPPGARFGTYGGFVFNNVAFVCVGGLLGPSTFVDANGDLGGCAGDPWNPIAPGPMSCDASDDGLSFTGCGPTAGILNLGQLCGTYNIGSTLLGARCSGKIGGPGVWNYGTGFDVGDDWSLVTDSLILGSIDCQRPTRGLTGAFALAAVPVPNSADSVLGPIGRDCAIPPNGEAGAPAVWFCEVAVTGVAVFVG